MAYRRLDQLADTAACKSLYDGLVFEARLSTQLPLHQRTSAKYANDNIGLSSSIPGNGWR